MEDVNYMPAKQEIQNAAEPWLKQRRNYLIGGTVRALAATGLMAYGGFVTGSFIGNFIDTNEVNQFESETERVEQIREEEVSAQSGDLDEANKNLNRISAEIGEACVSQMNLYVFQIQAEEDTVVNDILGNPSKPCGEVPTQVRQNFQKLTAAYSVVSQEQVELDEAKNRDADYIDNLEAMANDAMAVRWWDRIGLVAGGIAGIMMGADWSDRYIRRKKNEISESQQWMEYRLSKEFNKNIQLTVANDSRGFNEVENELHKRYGI